MHPQQHSAQTLRVAEAQARIGLAIPPDPLAGQIQPQRAYRAKCGRCRTFLSQADADAYDRGWASFDRTEVLEPQALNTPFSNGWFDRDAADSRSVFAVL